MQIPDGQLSKNERDYLYNTVTKINPKYVLESGTWKGGGSTLSITKGLHKNKNGILFTFEENQEFYNIAKNFYIESEYKENIKLFNEDFNKGLKNLDDSFLTDVNMVFLDGGDETPEGHSKLPLEEYIKNFYVSENVQSFIYLEKKLPVNCHILLHDWTIEIGRGNFVKRYLEETNNKNFIIQNILNDSTGLAHLVKIK